MNEEMVATTLGRYKTSYQPGEPLVVFLSGMGQFDTAETFANVIDLLPERYGVLAPDYLLSGKSGVALRDYTVYDEVDELAKIINAKNSVRVILVGHSIAGIYALLLADKINNLAGFVGIEPTTREVINHAPQTPEYLAAAAMDESFSQDDFEKWLGEKLVANFTPERVDQIWATYHESVARLTETDGARLQNFFASMPLSDADDNLRLPQTLASVVITESYRVAEFKRSEFMTANPRSQVLAGGTFHYIHWERPELVVEAIQMIAATN